MPVNKRNFQKQADHLEIARAIRDIKAKQQGKKDWREGKAVSYTHLDVYKRQEGKGRPKDSGTAQARVYEWRQQHPEGRKADCHRETGLDPKTVRKWWDCLLYTSRCV